MAARRRDAKGRFCKRPLVEAAVLRRLGEDRRAIVPPDWRRIRIRRKPGSPG